MSMTLRAHFDGKVIIPDEPVELPIDQPLTVQIIIPLGSTTSPGQSPYPLHGVPIRYDRPTDPVAEEDWEATQ